MLTSRSYSMWHEVTAAEWLSLNMTLPLRRDSFSVDRLVLGLDVFSENTVKKAMEEFEKNLDLDLFAYAAWPQ